PDRMKEEKCMPPMTSISPSLESLKDLTRLVQTAEGFHPVVAALKNGQSATVDGAWGSSGALVAGALGLHAPRTLLVVVAHPRDADGWVEDIATFAGMRPVTFPAWDNPPVVAPSETVPQQAAAAEIAGQRLRML